MEVLKKLQKARKAIKETPTEKKGRNTFSKYDYFTPDQVSKLVYDIEQELNLFHKFDLISSDNHIYGVLTIYDLDSSEEIEFKMLTDIPSIKATNSTQQLGGAMTYTNRYLLMNTYDIQDNNLDFDADKKETKKKTNSVTTSPEKEWLKDEDVDKVVKAAKEKGLGAKDLYEFYKISNSMMTLLNQKFE